MVAYEIPLEEGFCELGVALVLERLLNVSPPVFYENRVWAWVLEICHIQYSSPIKNNEPVLFKKGIYLYLVENFLFINHLFLPFY